MAKLKKHKRKSKNNRILVGSFFSIIIIIYLISSGVKLAKKTPLSIEIVQTGTINNNIKVNGIIIRNETVVRSNQDGNIQYLVYEGEKVKDNTPICMIGDNQILSEIKENIDKINENIIKVQNQRKEFSIIQKDIDNINYEIYNLINQIIDIGFDNDYSQIYSLKDSINSEIKKKYILLSKEQSSSLQNLISQKEEYENLISENSNFITAKTSGIISYYIDGFEEKFSPENLNSLTKSDFETIYKGKYITQNSTIKKEDPLFKVVDNYDWYVAGIVSKDIAKEWEINDEVLIKFNEEDITVKAKIYSIKSIEDSIVFVLQSTEQILPFIDKRNIEFEIIKDNYEGIKIPINAIVEKTFLKIPKNYIQYSGNKTVVIKKGLNKDELISVVADFEDEENIYVLQDFSSLKLYDILVFPENTEIEFTIKETLSKTGVFVVNGGIIKFKHVEILFQNKDYAIIENNNSSGIKIYDQIVSDATNVLENQFVNEFNVIENN
ncbi:HlyD family efflux transporter periplasmic adaptor subunit [Defluviitalea phaphyphila]|uniref:HlyD family efflux transporter periplasmic adaptor subunit n=1 Tax=Defluviitalea phaphyphila TaxID=1473580 RepID=UPI00073127B7|nr:HlyD family efflux transporter periplasmic adaptor subunit [Defluviitalea phaphyphila]